MIFWETTALLPLLVDEPASRLVRRMLEREPHMVIWWGTPIEARAALSRLEHEGVFSSEEVDEAGQLLDLLGGAWSEVLASNALRGHAERLLLRHDLRSADALQLAAALTWAEGQPRTHRLATLDVRLGAAARREGFVVLPRR